MRVLRSHLAGEACEMMEVWLDFDPAGFVATGLDVDDDLAFLALLALQRRGALRVVGVSVVAGNAALADTLEDARRLLRHAGVDWPLVSGASWRDMRVAWRWVRRLHGVRGDVAGTREAAARAMGAAVLAKPGAVTILALGPATNVAAALADPRVAAATRRVVLMGGTLDGGPLDLNWMSDRGAARDVLAAPVATTIAPVETCAQAAVKVADVDRFVAECCEPAAAACALAPKMRLQARWLPRAVNRHLARRFPTTIHSAFAANASAFVPWDVVALFAAVDPARYFDDWAEVGLDAPPCAGAEPCGGTVDVVPGRGRGAIADVDETAGFGPGLVAAPRRIRDPTALVDDLFELLCEVPAIGAPPSVIPGSLPALAGVGLATVLCALAPVAAWRRWRRRALS